MGRPTQKSKSKSTTLPSPADLPKILPSTSKSASAQPLEAITRRSQSYPHNASALVESFTRTPHSVYQQTPVPTSSRSVGGLTPPQSLNLELSTPESRPLLTPDQRHTFSSHQTHAGFMGCVDNPVFSTDSNDAGKRLPPGLAILADHTHPRTYVALSSENPQHQADRHELSDSSNVSGANTSSIAAAAGRVAAMREREVRAQSCISSGTASQEQQAPEKKMKRRKQGLQVAVDEGAEMLFSTAESAFETAEIESPRSTGAQEQEFAGHVNENQDENVPSPQMPHTVSTMGTSKQPKALPPLHRLPDLSLQPSAAKQAVADASNRIADVRVSYRSTSSSAQASAASSEDSASKKTAAGSRKVSITVGLATVPGASNFSEASDSGLLPPTDAAHAACRASAAYARAAKVHADKPDSKTASVGNSQAGSRGHASSSIDTFATVGSRVRSRDDSCTAAGWLGPSGQSSSVCGSGVLKSNSRAPLGQGTHSFFSCMLFVSVLHILSFF